MASWWWFGRNIQVLARPWHSAAASYAELLSTLTVQARRGAWGSRPARPRRLRLLGYIAFGQRQSTIRTPAELSTSRQLFGVCHLKPMITATFRADVNSSWRVSRYMRRLLNQRPGSAEPGDRTSKVYARKAQRRLALAVGPDRPSASNDGGK